MMATVPHVTSGSGLRKFQADGFLFDRVYLGPHVKCLIFLSDFNEKRFSRKIFEKLSNTNFMKIRLVGAELLHADRHTDRHDEANCRLSQFCKRA